jgi:hypothetical protein
MVHACRSCSLVDQGCDIAMARKIDLKTFHVFVEPRSGHRFLLHRVHSKRGDYYELENEETKAWKYLQPNEVDTMLQEGKLKPAILL